jgi:parallel beta-helix repeat protein
LSNNSPRTGILGTGILCDATSPLIENNIFTGDSHSGITTLGNAHPMIRNNTFTGSLSGILNWGVTAYEHSFPDIQTNTFFTKGGVDTTYESYPRIEGNSFFTSGTAIGTKHKSKPTIINNIIKNNNDQGIYIRDQSSPTIQDNIIVDNRIGILIRSSNPPATPDIGGGRRSTGGNEFHNDEWDLVNQCSNRIFARNNSWTHSPCCEWTDIHDVYDDEELQGAGAVDFGLCVYCRVMQPWRPCRF